MSRSALVDRPIDPAALIDEISSPGCGAVSLFLGTVRDTNEGEPVTGIDYTAYRAMAEAELAKIVDEAMRRFGGVAVVVEHRIGTLALGEISVAIVAAHAHRAAALDGVRYVIEELKRRVPIWKLEHYADGTRAWVDPTTAHRPRVSAYQ
ncbi:MAG TPA: molybdenum cofactor biosynthesis protein MoaE [Gemmatimonadaceae bacterium]|nr:molybdenum cofactor biosynthesis protein MoaE [Gemmatimonadaceae bacterium]